uniref:Apple domain-containing protein n=1 Tax=Parascaris equorum TaxID=6256 RepID=A0A914R718_PAREQ
MDLLNSCAKMHRPNVRSTSARMRRVCRISSRYSFQCASATYYHNERDCVLNLGSRIQRINSPQENFQTAFNVTNIVTNCFAEKERFASGVCQECQEAIRDTHPLSDHHRPKRNIENRPQSKDEEIFALISSPIISFQI